MSDMAANLLSLGIVGSWMVVFALGYYLGVFVGARAAPSPRALSPQGPTLIDSLCAAAEREQEWTVKDGHFSYGSNASFQIVYERWQNNRILKLTRPVEITFNKREADRLEAALLRLLARKVDPPPRETTVLFDSEGKFVEKPA